MQKGKPVLMFTIITSLSNFLTSLIFFLALGISLVLTERKAVGQIYPPWGFSGQPLVQRAKLGEVVVRFRPGTTPGQVITLSQRYGLRQITNSPFSGLQRLATTATIQGDLLQLLRFEPQIAYAEANFIRRANAFVPNDPLLSYQWHLRINDLPLAWELSSGDGVIVAVLDSGAAYENYLKFAPAPDLVNTAFIPGWDFVNNDAHPDDDNRHGTHITGIIAQSTNNLIGGAGIAFQSLIMPVKVLDAAGSGDVATIVDGIYYAVNNGAQIINLSFGSVGDPSSTEEEAINYAIEQGVLIVCSAGNEATNLAHYPSSYPGSFSVTATRFDNQFVAAYSNYGPDVDIAAPGGDLSVDQDGDGSPDGIYQQTHDGKNFRVFDFYYAEGTSSACAYVSGVAALVVARGKGALSVAQIRNILESTALDLGLAGWDEQYGWGVVNPLAALLAVEAMVNPQGVAAAAAQGLLLPTTFPGWPSPISFIGRRGVNSLFSLPGLVQGFAPSQSSVIRSGSFNTPSLLVGGLDTSLLPLSPLFYAGSQTSLASSNRNAAANMSRGFDSLWLPSIFYSPLESLFSPFFLPW